MPQVYGNHGIDWNALIRATNNVAANRGDFEFVRNIVGSNEQNVIAPLQQVAGCYLLSEFKCRATDRPISCATCNAGKNR